MAEMSSSGSQELNYDKGVAILNQAEYDDLLLLAEVGKWHLAYEKAQKVLDHTPGYQPKLMRDEKFAWQMLIAAEDAYNEAHQHHG